MVRYVQTTRYLQYPLTAHMQRMEQNNEVRAVVDNESARKKTKGETKREMDGLLPKGYAGTADHPRECPGQNILEIKNSGR